MSGAACLADPAFRLLAACADWPRGDARNDAVCKAAQALDGDWDRFLAQVDRHRMAPMALDGLTSAGLDAPEKLLRRAQRDKRKALSIAVEGRRLLDVLQAAGIDGIILKGPLVSQQIFGDPAMRQCADLDVLVAEADMAEARRLAGEEGYMLQGPEPPWGEGRMRYWRMGAKDLTLFNPDKRIVLELHYRLQAATGSLPDLGLSDARAEVDLAGVSMRSFADADLFSYLCVHGGVSLWNRLKWLADIRAILSNKDAGEIGMLLDHACAMGVGRCAALALLMCENVWDQQLPDAAKAMRASDPHLALLEKRSLQAMGDPEAKLKSIGSWRLASAQFRLRDDWAYRRSLLASILVDPQIVSTIKLPRWLGLLYVPARLLSWSRNRMK